MKLKLKEVVSNLKKLKGVIAGKLIDQKKNFAKIVAGIAILMVASFLIEYFVFGYKLNVVEKTQKEYVFENKDIENENFSLNVDGSYVSQAPNARLTVSAKKRYINNLELDVTENKGNSIFVKYVDLKSGKDVTIENKLQKNILKNKLDFMKFFVFHLDSSPENIQIEVRQPGTIISAIKIDNQYYFNHYRFLFVLAIGLLIWSFYLLRKRIGEKPEFGFLAVALICGSLLVFSQMKSFISWDDHIHYKNADSLTMKNVFNKNIEDIYARTNSVPYSLSIKEQEKIDNFFDNKVKKVSKSKKTWEFMSVKELYNKVGYLPAAAALTLGRILHLPYHVIFMLGRFANVLVYSIVVFFAIRKLKSGKMLLAVIALFPTSIFVAANYSYDFWVTSFTMLGLAYLFSELQQPEKKISKRDVIIMLGAFIIGLGPKAIYFPLMFLLFLLKSSKFKSAGEYKKFIWATTLSILIVLGSFLLPFIVSGEGGGDMRGGAAVNSAEQVKFILSQPVEYAKILLNFIAGYVHPFNAGGLITSFAYLGSIQGFTLLMFVLIFVTITDRNKTDKEIFDWKIKLFMIGIYVVTVSLVSTALYVAFTPVASKIIAGVQTRYLTPLVFPLLYIVGSSRMKNPIRRDVYNVVVLGIVSVVMLNGIWDLITKFYY